MGKVVITPSGVDIKKQSLEYLAISIGQVVSGVTIDIGQITGTVNFNLRASEIMMPIDLQSSFIMLPIDIQAQYVTLDINIVAQEVALDINIASQSASIAMDIASASIGNLSVSIAGQISNVNIAVVSQNIALKLSGDWAAEQNTDLDVGSFNYAIGSQATANILTYTPSGFAFYIEVVSIHTHGVNTFDINTTNVRELVPFYWKLAVGGTDKLVGACKGGQAITLTKPIKVASGTQLIVQISNGQDRSVDYCATLHGYKV